ncbi:unnamed protein product [Adineta steineri]|uniref:Apple domain-containing protein n=1 Tax=Adineta steineri TaxID=433720 RepID=A0A816ETC9_9BILA|nr:unnamed protein product [Adineta steineri]CAF1650710.1 unnamed protein product [Adineta steineri]
MKHTIISLLHITIVSIIFVIPIDSQNIKTLLLTERNDIRYECTNSSCSTPTIILGTNLRDCQLACLTDNNCRTITFDPSINQCELFTDSPSQYGSLIPQIGVVTFTADDRQPPTRK